MISCQYGMQGGVRQWCADLHEQVKLILPRLLAQESVASPGHTLVKALGLYALHVWKLVIQELSDWLHCRQPRVVCLLDVAKCTKHIGPHTAAMKGWAELIGQETYWDIDCTLHPRKGFT